jgi:hypothetical protein
MPSRFAIAVLLASISPMHASFAQQISSDVVISGASLNDGYMGRALCDADGQLYRGPNSHRASIMRVARDGSTLLFTLPASEDTIDVFAPAPSGLFVLNSSYSRAEGISYRLYRFDSQGSLLTQHRVSIDFHPSAMAITSSSKTIVVGFRPQNGTDREARKYGVSF